MAERLISRHWRDLNRTERDILVAIARGGPANAAELGRRIQGKDGPRPNVAMRLKDLAEAGLVERDDSAPGPQKINHLKTEGVVALKRGVLDPAEDIFYSEGE